jgi:regulator of protease activity HflC (stomatin/prohibitin superfamily)
LVGLAFEVVLTTVFILLSVWSDSQSMWGLTRLAAVGITIWLFLVLLYHQRALVWEESLETEQLRKERKAGTGSDAIFDVESEEFLLARRRLQWMYKWVLPFFTLVIFIELLVAAFGFWSWDWGLSVRAAEWESINNPNLLVWFVGAAAFLSFLLSRYIIGMARQPEWRMLHAGAGYLMAITLAGAALAGTLAALHYIETPVPEHVLAYVIRIILLVLAAEVLLNFVIDFYRPRAPDDEPRPAFDSRLLGLFCEPEGIARSIAEAINYQFGFEVSSTWFYKLLQRSVIPLIGFAIATLFAASCLVFVHADEQAVIEHFGRKVSQTLAPGAHLKWPWPIDIVYKVPTARIHELKIGIAEKQPKQKHAKEELILWTNEHSSEPHLNVLVATPRLAEYITPAESVEAVEVDEENQAVVQAFGQAGEAVPVSQLRVSASLQYQIMDAYQWIATYEEPEAMLEAIAEREVTRYCASVEVEELVGEKRGQIEKALWRAIKDSVKSEDVNLGVDIVFFGLQGIHPPVDTAEAFQDVIGSEQKRTAAIRSAEIDYNKRLTEVAGNRQKAELLDEAIRAMNALEVGEGASPEAKRKYETAQQRVLSLFFGDLERDIPPIGGEAARIIVEANAKRWKLANQAHGDARIFLQEIATKNNAPTVYRLRKYLEALAESLAKIRKYVLATRGEPYFYLDLQDPMSAPMDILLEGEE